MRGCRAFRRGSSRRHGRPRSPRPTDRVLVPRVVVSSPGWQLVALIDGALQAAIQLLEFGTEMRFYACYGIEASIRGSGAS